MSNRLKIPDDSPRFCLQLVNVLLLSLLLGACRDNPTEPDPHGPAVEPFESLSFSIITEPDPIWSGNRFHARLAVENVGDDPVALRGNCTGALAQLGVFDENGDRLDLVGSTWGECQAGEEAVEIGTGDVVEQEWELWAWHPEPPNFETRLAPGVYTLKAALDISAVDSTEVSEVPELEAEIEVRDAYDALEVSFELSRAVVAQGDTFQTRLSVRNATPETLDLEFACFNVAYYPEAVDHDGEWVRLVNDVPALCFLAPRSFTLAPGEMLEWVEGDGNDVLTYTFEATRRAHDDSPGGLLEPGPYLMRAEVQLGQIGDAPVGRRLLAHTPFEVVAP